MSRRPDPALLAFEALTIEGGLLPAEWLGKIAALKAKHQATSDYGIPKGLNLRDELGRYWRIATAQWHDFDRARSRTDEPHAVTRRFITTLLRDVFGFADLTPEQTPVSIDERLYPLTAQAREGRVPLVVAAHNQRLEERDIRFGDEGRQRSAFGLLQDYLNAAEPALWGLASNGCIVRLARDNASFTRPAWIEADLERIFGEERFADFSALWLLIHASRFGNADDPPQACALETWREASREEGTRARDKLRQAVHDALLDLGQGFLTTPGNTELRKKIGNTLTPTAYFQQLLRLVYRLIFLLTIEERGLLHPEDSAAETVELYRKGYSLHHLRERSRRRRAFDRHHDVWQGLKPVFTGLAHGQPLLALPALGGLFADDQCADLDAVELGNSALLSAIYRLTWMHEDGALVRINWRDMGPEEFGSVYESLLELVPDISADGRRFDFADPTQAKGNQRKTTGSYYTPDVLVQELLDSALQPVIEQRLAAAADQEQALLAITVCDPACGSGHFLLAAARRMANQLARLRAQGTPSGDDFRHALRDVIGHCIYGVDMNPMALELARMSLWLEAMTPDKPLGFLDHHLQCGDALLGLADLAVLEQGIPKDAFKALSGDDKAVCKALGQQNSSELKNLKRRADTATTGGQYELATTRHHGLDALRALEAMPEASLNDIATKQTAWQAFADQAADSPLRHAADMYMAAFLLPKTRATEASIPATGSVLMELAGQHGQLGHATKREAALTTCEDARVLHWPLAFPLVFAAGGFTCMLANPPWDVLQLNEEEFFASRDADITSLAGTKRKQAIARLETDNPRLWKDYIDESHRIAASNNFYRSGRYPLTAVGKLNTYPLFAEAISHLTAESGRAGFIVPTGIATDDSTKVFFASLAQSQRLVILYGFENEEFIFPSVHHAMKFCLLVTTGGAQVCEPAEFVHFARHASHVTDSRRRFTLTPDDFRLVSPNTLTCPVFRSERDAELTKKLYRAAPILINETRNNGNPWGITFSQGLFNMTSDSHLFADAPGKGRLPLYEAKLIHQFDHRWATYENDTCCDATLEEKADPNFTVTPRYWVDESEVRARLDAKGWQYPWLMGWRDITNATNERTVIASVVPYSGVGHTLPQFMTTQTPPSVAALLGNLNSFVLDYVARVKVGGTHLTYGYLKQFPVLPPDRYTDTDLAFIVPRVLELTYTAHDLAGWAAALGYEGEPFAFDSTRRAQLYAELNVYYAHLYGLTYDELHYILDPADVMSDDYPSRTFHALKNREICEYGEYCTRNIVLDTWRSLDKNKPSASQVFPGVRPTPVHALQRRQEPRPEYLSAAMPRCEAEDWFAGVACDVLREAGPLSESALFDILATKLPTEAPHIDAWKTWASSNKPGRQPDMARWFREQLGLLASGDLYIPDDADLTAFLGDNRTRELASILIATYRTQESDAEQALARAQKLSASTDDQKYGKQA